MRNWIIPHLNIGSRGIKIKVPLFETVESIFYRLKTGYQWRELPTKQFFDGKRLLRNSPFIDLNGLFLF
jgi:hypothetical protein